VNVSHENPGNHKSIVACFVGAIVVLAPFAGCGARTPDVVAPATGPSIWSPPGAVASFLIESGEPKPVRTYDGHTWADLRGSLGHSKHQGLETVLCRDCHQKGFQEKGGGGCGRTGCHEKEALHTHGVTDSAERSGCVSCHSFEPGKALPACMDCHKETQTKHEPRKVAAASASASGASGASGASIAPIVDGHAKAACGKCHNPHKEPLSSAAECSSCHKQTALAHSAHKDSKGCSDCHATHSLASSAKSTCQTCHKEPAGDRPAGHASCLTCHKPHAEKQGAIACVTCHKQRALRADTVAAHANCESCHTAHAPKAVSDASCSKCHWKVRLQHAKGANATGTSVTLASYASKGAKSVNTCAACHAPHPDEAGQKVQACTTCHVKLGEADVGAHAAKLSCTSCHSAHDFGAPAKATVGLLCARCHEAETKLVATNKGHGACLSCHVSTHKETAPPTCQSCHAAETKSAPTGHQTCDTCHAKHSGKLTTGAACTTCHAKKQTGPHVGVKNGCQTCHRAHGPNGVASPPTCQSCHETSKLAGLHGAKGHTDCLKCHSSHAAPKATHENCTNAGCHTNRKAHQPDAKSCIACHVFRPQQPPKTGG
jgi:hypothetical protein